MRDSSRRFAPLSRRLFSKQPVLSVPTITDKIRVQKRGRGLGFLPCHHIAHLLTDRTFAKVPVKIATADAPIYMAWKTNNKGRALHWFAYPSNIDKHAIAGSICYGGHQLEPEGGYHVFVQMLK